MKTLAEMMEWIEARAVRDGDCLIWKQSFNGAQPQGGKLIDGRKVSVNVRRMAWELKHERQPRKNWVVVCKCETPGCVEPSHLREISRSKMLSGIQLTPTHKAALTRAARNRKSSKLTQEAVDDIRRGDGTIHEKAQRYGVSSNHVNGIIKGRWWRDIRSPFRGLGV
jgi:hypothetical protein